MARPQINVLVSPHSQGLLRDADVLKAGLEGTAFGLTTTSLWRDGSGLGRMIAEMASVGYRLAVPFDVNVHVEDLKARWLSSARQNWWMPNKEWVRPKSLDYKHRVDLVLCKTREGEAIFSAQRLPTVYTGFSSPDRYRAEIPRSLRAVHVAGFSDNKGTRAVLDAWSSRPEWPMLDLIWNAPSDLKLPRNVRLFRSPVDDTLVSELQNSATLHVCPSSMEGFGHTLVEAMSCGACIVTTDAPPMNELVSGDRGILVPWDRSEDRGMARAYHVSVEGLTRAIDTVLHMSDLERTEIGRRAREWFLQNDRAYRNRLALLVKEQLA